MTIYTIVRTGIDVDRGSFPGPAAERSFFSPLRARKELQRLVCAEKEKLDDRYDCEDQDEDYWEMYQDGNAAALFVRLEVVPSELILMSAGEKEEVKGSLEEETEAKECLSRMWRIFAQLKFELLNCKTPYRLCGMTGLPKDYCKEKIIPFEAIQESCDLYEQAMTA